MRRLGRWDLGDRGEGAMRDSKEVLRPFLTLVARVDLDGALSYLEGLGSEKAEPWWIAYHLGKVHEYRQEWDQALCRLEEAAQLAPTNPAVWHGTGLSVAGAAVAGSVPRRLN